MLVGFSVENYKSFAKRSILKMCAGKGRLHKNHYIKNNNKNILKTAMIFGANASGKTNLIKAISFSKNIIINGIYESINDSYFKIDNKYLQVPGVFDYDIIIGDTEYSYGIAISYDKSKIISEWLYIIKRNGEDICVFERNLNEGDEYSVVNDVKYNRIKNKCYDAFNGKVTEELAKKTILSDIAERNRGKTKELQEIINIYDWFNEKLMIIYPTSIYMGINESKGNNLYEIVEFDTGIEKLNSKKVENTLENLFRENHYSDEILKKRVMKTLSLRKICPFNLIDGSTIILKDIGNGKVLYNKIEFNHGNKDSLFQYSEESDGTKRLLDLLPFFSFHEDTTIVVDEIDRSLHTVLLREFLKRFYCKCKNEKKQLIMTTHDTNIMDLDVLRQDEIWFVERDNNHNSNLYSLSKFKVRFDTIVERNYLLGRYGGLPIIDQIVSNEVENE